MFFKQAPDRPLIQEAHQHCVRANRSLSHEFDCLNDVFGSGQRRSIGPRKYLLRRVEKPLILPRLVVKPKLSPKIPPKMPPKQRPKLEPIVIVLDDTESSVEQSETELEPEEEPMDRIVFQFAHTEPVVDAMAVELPSPSIEWSSELADELPSYDDEDQDEEVAEAHTAWIEEAESLRRRYDEYRRDATPSVSQDEMEQELQSIQTLQVVVGENTVYCQ